MKVIKLDRTRKTDFALEKIAKKVKKTIKKKNDDHLLMIAGTTGTGKTTLSFHYLKYFLGEEPEIKYIGLNEKDYATALSAAKAKKEDRYCVYDEANVSKRDHAKTYNKDLIKMFFSIRGLNMLHIWSNPSVDMIDKPFIEERIKGLILITNKSSPRNYLYFTKKSLIKIFTKHKKLTHDVLKKNKDLAWYKGFFFDYEGNLKDDYLPFQYSSKIKDLRII